MTQRNLAAFTGAGYIKGRGTLWQVSWVVSSALLVRPSLLPSSLRVAVLRAFGAKIGKGVVIRSGVRVHWPWKLDIGDHTWIGIDAYLLNLEQISIGSNVCISQQALVCTGSHDHTSVTFEFDNDAIYIRDGAWVAARAIILRGSDIGEESVIGANAVAQGKIPPRTIVRAPRNIVETY